MKIMVLNDGETFTDIQGCQIVEVSEDISDDDIEDILKTINRHNEDSEHAKIIGGFDQYGNFLVGDPRCEGEKKKIIIG
jgi:hypothetical protein